MSQLERRTFQKGDLIFREGDWEMCMYSIAEGAVSIWADYGAPCEKRLAILGAGQYFGEMGLVDAMCRSASAVAEENCTVEVISGKDLDAWYRSSPDKVVELMKQIGLRTRELTENYIDACRTAAELQSAETAGESVSEGLAEKLRRFALIWKKNSRA